MIVYRSTKAGFQDDVGLGRIDQIIEAEFERKLRTRIAAKEVDSWWHSLQFMSNILNDRSIPDDTGVSIECQLPQSSKRIDFILSGRDHNHKENVIIVELKQWKKVELTDKDGIVRTALGRGLHETSHPSYQAWSYAAMITDFSATVEEDSISLFPCAYLHNCEDEKTIKNPFYQTYLDVAPAFLKRDADKLRQFIKDYVKYGDGGEIMYRIDQGKIRPSKQLADSLSRMLKGNREFILIDEQKLVYETALSLCAKAQTESKQVLIVEGGPGTGKSVVAINLLVEITRRGLLAQYVSKNSAPRIVYERKLSGTLGPTRFRALFQGSGSFVGKESDKFDALIVDEAHRLNEKSGMYENLGENQIKEIIHASKMTVFFIDEDQRVAIKDIGSKDEIRKHARRLGAQIHELELSSQFRCNGSDGYLAFLDNLLQIRETANPDFSGIDYDFRVCDSPSEVRDIIFEKNREANKARMVAGYCWDWKSKKNPAKMDIEFPEYDFGHQWNLSTDGMLWIVQPESVNEIGCIHTCQGLEVDYVGVIIGPDLIIRDGIIKVDPTKRSSMDRTIRGYKALMERKPTETKALLRTIIKNTYRTLMTRGAKGCYVWCVDPELNEWMKKSAGI